MYARMLIVALLFHPIVYGDTIHRHFRFDRKLAYDDSVCKDSECVFIRSAESHVACSIPCLANHLCAGFFYNNVTKMCYGNKDAIRFDDFDYARLNGTTYYEKQIDVIETETDSTGSTSDNPTSSSTTSKTTSTPTPTSTATSTDRTTALAITPVTDRSENAKMTSDPGSSQIPPGPVVHITLWENSSYHLLRDRSMPTLQKKCKSEGPDSHLAWIDSPEENDHLAKFLANSHTYAAYIGFEKVVNANTKETYLVYHPGGKLATYFAPWIGHENVYVNCIQLNARGHWESADCNVEALGICERDVKDNPAPDLF